MRQSLSHATDRAPLPGRNRCDPDITYCDHGDEKKSQKIARLVGDLITGLQVPFR